MEFQFNISYLLPRPIEIVDCDYSCIRRNKVDNYEQAKKHLSQIIDEMGTASSKAQALRGCITSGVKLRCSDHRLYVLRDSADNKNIIDGILKVGVKKLFVMDLQNNQLEVNPLCVLDFYVHESKQRAGCGKKLFEFMLQNENVVPANLAYDRPSIKFLAFLKKHYELKNPYQQANSFVVFDLFFRDLQAAGYVQSRNRLGTSNNRPPIHPYRKAAGFSRHEPRNGQSKSLWDRPTGRHSATRPSPRTETAQSHCHPVQTENTTLPPVSLPPITLPTTVRRLSAGGEHSEIGQVTTGDDNDAYNSNRGLGARASLYSRHTVSRDGSAGNKRTLSRPNSGNRPGSRPDSGHNTPGMHPGSLKIDKCANKQANGVVDISNNYLDSNGNYIVSNGYQPLRNLQKTSSDNPLGNTSLSQCRASTSGVSPSYSRNPSLINNRPVIGSAPVQNIRANSSNGATSYTVSSMYNSQYGPTPSLGSAWNIFGVPTSSKTTNKIFQTWSGRGRQFPF